MPEAGLSIQERGPWANLGAVAATGECFASDPRGTATYIYHLHCASDGLTATFERIHRTTGVRQALAAPGTVGGAARFGLGTSILVDPSAPAPLGGGGLLANVWLVHTRNNAPFMGLQFWDAATNAWTAASQAGGAFDAAGLGNATLTGQWNGDIAMAHPCTTVGLAASDDFLYMVGGNTNNTGATAVQGYRYQISTGTVAAMTARAAAVGNGCSLTWISKWPDRLYSRRGGGAALFDRYGIAGAAWTAVAPIPNTETYDLGARSIGVEIGNQIVFYQNGRLLSYSPQSNETTEIGAIYGDDGTVHAGDPLAWMLVGNEVLLYACPHSGSKLQRIRVIA